MRRSVFVGVAALAGCAHVIRRGPDESPSHGTLPAVRIAVLGDSLALGTGASHPDGGFIFRAYRSVLAQRPGSRIDSYAMGGATAVDVLRVQVPRLRGATADVAVLCVGGNDVVRRFSAAAFAANVRAIVDGMRRELPHARLVLCGVPDVALSPLFAGFDATELQTLARDDDRAVRTIATAAGAAFVDLYAVTQRARRDAGRFLSDDRFHPSDRGYAVLAEALTPVLLRAAGGA